MWSTSEHLQAATVDLLNVLRWMYVEAHRDTETHPQPWPMPAPLPRPGDPADVPDPASAYAGDAPAISLTELGSWLSA